LIVEVDRLVREMDETTVVHIDRTGTRCLDPRAGHGYFSVVSSQPTSEKVAVPVKAPSEVVTLETVGRSIGSMVADSWPVAAQESRRGSPAVPFSGVTVIEQMPATAPEPAAVMTSETICRRRLVTAVDSVPAALKEETIAVAPGGSAWVMMFSATGPPYAHGDPEKAHDRHR